MRLDEINNQLNDVHESSALKVVRELTLSSCFSVQDYASTLNLESTISESLKILNNSQAQLHEFANIGKMDIYNHLGIFATSPTNNLFDLTTQFNEQLELLSNPFKNIHKDMKYLYEPMKKINDDMEKILNPISGFQEQIDSIFNPKKNIFDTTFQSITQTTSAYQKFMDLVLDTNKISFDLGSTYLNTTLDSYSSIEKMFKQFHFPSSAEKSIQDLVEEILDKTKVFETEIITRDEITYLKELESIREEVLENVQLIIDSKINEAVKSLKLFITSQNNPYMTYLVQLIIFPLIVNLVWTLAINPKINEIMSSYEHQHIIKKEIVSNIKHYVQNSKQLVQFRIVSCDILNVRQEKSTKSEIISYLSFGEVVEIVQKNKNWCLVRKYDSGNEIIIQGWVFTRYLSKIK